MAARTSVTHKKRRRTYRRKEQKVVEVVKRSLSWPQAEVLIATIQMAIYQSNIHYNAILIISRGGLVPGCLLAEGFNEKKALPVAVDRYPDGARISHRKPQILYFPKASAVRDQNVLVVDDVWDFGDSYDAVLRELMKCGPALAHTAALIFKPTRNRYPGHKPDFYAEETGDWVEFPWETYPKRVLARLVAPFSMRRPTKEGSSSR